MTGNGGAAPGGPADSALDALFAEYLATLEAEGHGATPPAEVIATFAARAGPLVGPFLRRVSLLGRLAQLGRARTAPDDAPPVARQPDRIGRYEIRERVGAGGSSRVLRARDPLLARDVVLKLLDHAPAARDREYLLNDARALGRLSHPSIVRVLDVDSDGERDFVVMEFVPGPSLAAIIAELRERARGTRGVPAVAPELARAATRLAGLPARVRLVERLAEALDVCHRRGVVHRDVKPSNVLVRPDGSPVLIDFGIAHFAGSRAAVTESLVGTPAYLAPEQVANERTGASPASDQFSLGVLLYELLTLRQPFQRATREETLAAVIEADVPPPSAVAAGVTRDVERLCLHALERDPADRYPSLAAFAADLAAARELRPLSLPEPSPLAPLLRRVRRHRRRIAGVTALVVVVGFAWFAGDRAVRAAAVDAELTAVEGAGPRTPVELHEAARGLLDVERALRTLTADPLGRWIAGDLPRRLADARRAWSRELATRIAADAADSQLAGTALNWSPWRKLLALDERVAPDGVHNLRDRQRGRVFLPAGVDPAHVVLEQHLARGPRGFAYSLGALAFDTVLDVGCYRITQYADADHTTPLRQVDFRVEPGDVALPPRRLDLPAVRAGFWDGALALDPRTVEVEGVVPDATVPVTLPATWVSRDVVRVRDIVPWLLEERPFDVLGIHAALDLDAPALLTWVEASNFARWCGLRLPTPLEWHAAAREPGFRRAAGHLARDHVTGVRAEFLGGPLVQDVRAARVVVYEAFDASGAAAQRERVAPALWTEATVGRPDGVMTTLPRAVRASMVDADSQAYARTVSQTYRTTAFRLATNVPPPAP